MAGKSAVMSVRIVADAKQASGEISQFERSLDKLDSVTSKATPAFAAAGAGLLAFGATAGAAAAEAEQNFGAVNTVFDGASQKIHDWAAASAQTVGLASSDYESLAASIGGSLSKAGYSQDELASKTNDLISAGADLSSVFGGDAAGAAEAMGAALRGEFDSLEQYGVFMSASAVEARMAAEGTDQLTGAAYDAAKQQATVNEIMAQAGAYQGNFAREADTAAGAQQRAKAAAENAAATLGQVLLPYLTQGANALAAFAGWAMENQSTVTKFAAAIGIAVGVFFAARGAIIAVQTATQLWAGAQWAINAAMSANPIGLVVVAIAALVAAVVWAYNNVEWFRDGVDAALEWVKNAWSAAGEWIKAAWDAVVSFFGTAGQRISDSSQQAAQWVQDKWGAATQWVQDKWGAATQWVQDKWNGFTGFFSDTQETIKGAATAAATLVYQQFQQAVENVKGFFTGLRDWIKGIFDNIGQWAGNIKDKITGLFDNFKLPEMPGWVKDIIGSGALYENDGGDWYAPATNLWAEPPFNITASSESIPMVKGISKKHTTQEKPTVVYNITVNGALDKLAAAREIESLLRAKSELIGYG